MPWQHRPIWGGGGVVGSTGSRFRKPVAGLYPADARIKLNQSADGAETVREVEDSGEVKNRGIKGKAGVHMGVQIVFVVYKSYLKSTSYGISANPIIAPH